MRNARLNLMSSPSAADRRCHTFGVVHHIPVRCAHEEQVRHLQKVEAVSRLSAGIAHDFNNLLSVILGAASSLDEGLTDPLQRALLADVLAAAGRGADLTRQLLATSRKQGRRVEALDLGVAVTQVKRMLDRLLPSSITLWLACAPDLWRVEADRGQLEQVIINLVINARDAMPCGGRLTIETANVDIDAEVAAQHGAFAPGRYVMLAVADDGIGMEPSVRERVFEPFFTTKAPDRGSGLGLATVHGIVAESGGDIWVESAPGKGATFRVHLPARSERSR